jgi:hypothetical protein
MRKFGQVVCFWLLFGRFLLQILAGTLIVLKVLGVILSPSGQTPGLFLRLRYNCSFSNPFQDIIHCDFTV